jgi:hypothetical protein
MAPKKKVSIRLQLSATRKSEADFIEHLNCMRDSGSKIPEFVLKMAMIGMNAHATSSEQEKPTQNGGQVNLGLSEDQIDSIAQKIAAQLRNFEISEGLNDVLSHRSSTATIHPETQVPDPDMLALKGKTFF